MASQYVSHPVLGSALTIRVPVLANECGRRSEAKASRKLYATYAVSLF